MCRTCPRDRCSLHVGFDEHVDRHGDDRCSGAARHESDLDVTVIADQHDRREHHDAINLGDRHDGAAGQPSPWRLRRRTSQRGLLDDRAFFAPYAPYFDARIGRPSVPMETYLRMMFLKFRYRLGYETLCREVGDSISWQRFCRIPFGTRVPHPTTLMKLTRRCGDAAVAGLNDALLAKAVEHKLLRTDKVRASTHHEKAR